MISLKAFERRRLLQELILVGIGYFLYSQVRGLAGDRTADAFRNAYWIVDFERNSGIFKELLFQKLILPHDLLVHAANLIYFYGLFPLMVPTAVWLFIRHPRQYLFLRTAFLASGGIALIFFLLLPVAPPRLLGMGFVDTLGLSFVPAYSSIPGVNHFAAVPSMHVGWSLLTAIGIGMAVRGRLGQAIAIGMPTIMLVATVTTGNHYFLDGLMGIVVALIGLGLALRLHVFRGNLGALFGTAV